MKTIIAGSRHIENYFAVTAAIARSGWQFKITEVVSGTNGRVKPDGKIIGVDRLGERWAVQHGISIAKFPADWQKFGKRAGPLRNEQMAQYADALILIWDGISKGSADMLRRAQVHGLLVYVHKILPIGKWYL